jgi:hypothetical protein
MVLRAGVLLAVVSTGLAASVGSEPRGARGLVVKVVEVDRSSLAPLTSSAMHDELGLVLKPASLAVAWRRSRPGAETDPDEVRLVFLRSTGLGADRGLGVLGSTARHGSVPTTWIYVPNVALALGLDPETVPASFEAQRVLGVALGRVVAHELVHVLAPGVEHAGVGLMRPKLHAFHLSSGRPALEGDCAVALAEGARSWSASSARWLRTVEN